MKGNISAISATGAANLASMKSGVRNPLPWLDAMLNGLEHANFFENRATEYSKAATQGRWDEAFASDPSAASLSALRRWMRLLEGVRCFQAGDEFRQIGCFFCHT